MNNNKTEHWRKINGIVWQYTWDAISHEIRDVISADNLGMSESSKWFAAHCEAETNHLFEDETFRFNKKSTFSKA